MLRRTVSDPGLKNGSSTSPDTSDASCSAVRKPSERAYPRVSMSSSVVSSRRQSPSPGPVPARPSEASPDSSADIPNSNADRAASDSTPASTRWPASSTATTRTSPETSDRLSIRTSPAWPCDDADGTYGTVCTDSSAQAPIPNSNTAIRANPRHVDNLTTAPLTQHGRGASAPAPSMFRPPSYEPDRRDFGS